YRRRGQARDDHPRAGQRFLFVAQAQPDGERIAWQTWNHPHMPWDSSEIWVGELDRDGNLTSKRRVAGGPEESVLQPEWSPSGELYFISDRSDWWDLYRACGAGDEAVCLRPAALAVPPWAIG